MESSRSMTVAEAFSNTPPEFFSVERKAKIYGKNGKIHGERIVTLMRNGETYWCDERSDGTVVIHGGKIMYGYVDSGIGA